MNAPAQPRFSGGPLADSPRVLLLVDWISTTEWCALLTAMDAYRGYSLWIPADCVASHSSERPQAALLSWLGANVGASEVVSDDVVQGELARQP